MTAQRVRHAWSKHAFVWGHLPLFSALTVLVTKIGLCVSDRVTCNGLNNWSDYSVNTRLAVLSGVWVVRQTAFIHFKYPSWAINKWKQRCCLDSECNVNIYLKKIQDVVLHVFILYWKYRSFCVLPTCHHHGTAIHRLRYVEILCGTMCNQLLYLVTDYTDFFIIIYI